MILTAVMAHQRKLIRQAAVATLIAANTAAGAQVKATRVEPNKHSKLPALGVYTLGDDTDMELSKESAPRELTRDMQLEITGWVAHKDSAPADDAMDDLAEQIEAAMDANRYLAIGLVVTAFDHTTGKVTSAAHGLVTGSGPVQIGNVGGGVLPAGLSATRQYWAIVVDANTIQLAKSSTDALAGTVLGFTTNGTLPLQVIIARAAESILTGTEIQLVEDDGRSDPLIGIITLSYLVKFRTSPAVAALGDFTTLDAKYPIVGVADTLVPEDTTTIPT